MQRLPHRLVLWLLPILAPPLFAADLTVPGTHATIAAALADAAPGDTISVQPGVYLERDLDFGGKDLRLVAVGGPDVTTIDAGALDRHFRFHLGETSAAVLEGFTLTGGRAPDGKAGLPDGQGGGAILVDGASPSVIDCRFDACVAGTGLDGYAGHNGQSATIYSPATPGSDGGPGGDGGSGGAVLVLAGEPTFERCTFLDCRTGDGGAGGDGGDGGNGFSWQGGADGGDAGEAGDAGRGGAVAVLAGGATLRSCLVVGGSVGAPGAGGQGGSGGKGLISGNPGADGASTPPGEVGEGGGLWSSSELTRVLACTLTGSSGSTFGGLGGSAAVVRSSIVWGNTPDQLPSGLDVAWCDVPGAAGNGNFEADPLFADPGSGDFHLTILSPCLSAGEPGAPDHGTLDLDGEPRVLGPGVDVGADEYTPEYPGTFEDLVLAVEVNAGGDPWTTPKTTLAGDLLRIELSSPGGTFVGALPLLLFQGYATGSALGGSSFHPSVWIDPLAPGLVILSFGTTPLGPVTLPAVGLPLTVAVQPGLVGLTVRIQGVALGPAAANGSYSTTHAMEVIVQ